MSREITYTTTSNDEEIAAIELVLLVLEPLPADTQARVLQYIRDRKGM